MKREILLFGFDQLPVILAARAAAGPFGAEVVPVAKTDYNKPLSVLAGLDTAPGPMAPYAGSALGGRMIVLCGLEDRLDALLPELGSRLYLLGQEKPAARAMAAQQYAQEALEPLGLSVTAATVQPRGDGTLAVSLALLADGENLDLEVVV